MKKIPILLALLISCTKDNSNEKTTVKNYIQHWAVKEGIVAIDNRTADWTDTTIFIQTPDTINYPYPGETDTLRKDNGYYFERYFKFKIK